MYEEKDKRVLAFQAKLNELKEKVPALEQSELYRHRSQFHVLVGYIGLTTTFAIEYTAESPDILYHRIMESLLTAKEKIQESIEILEGLE